jgi:hypothetical protein
MEKKKLEKMEKICRHPGKKAGREAGRQGQRDGGREAGRQGGREAEMCMHCRRRRGPAGGGGGCTARHASPSGLHNPLYGSQSVVDSLPPSHPSLPPTTGNILHWICSVSLPAMLWRVTPPAQAMFWRGSPTAKFWLPSPWQEGRDPSRNRTHAIPGRHTRLANCAREAVTKTSVGRMS